MIRLIVSGAAGRMGRAIISLLPGFPEVRLYAAIEAPGNPAVGNDAGVAAGVTALGVPISTDYDAVAQKGTVTVEFTAPTATLIHLRTAVRNGAAMVIGTTGFDEGARAELDALAPRTPCVIAANMSVGVNVLLKLVAQAARTLGSAFDPEIVEMHHRMKVDAPSGTALALARAVAENTGRNLTTDARYGRQGTPGKRTEREIGILALRGGDVVGDHTVIFAGDGERLELTHRAQSRDCLAGGAIRAALWVANKPPGRYSMADVLGL